MARRPQCRGGHRATWHGTPGRELIRYLGVTGVPVHQVENAFASGSSAFRNAVQEVAGGFADVAIAIGVDKADQVARGFAKSRVPTTINDVVVPAAHFALLLQSYLSQSGASIEDVAAVAVKNHGNGARNPFAQRRTPRTLQEVLAPPRITGELTRLLCTPVGEGAAAVIVASDDAIHRLGVDATRCVRVVSSASQSEVLYDGENFDVALTRATVAQALEHAGVEPADLDSSNCTTHSPSRSCSTRRRSGCARPGRRPTPSQPASSTSVAVSP